jgi:uncharacterized protein YndB with AHSA1/START domain
MPQVTATRVIQAPQQEIWAALSDIKNATRWNTAWPRIDMTSNQTHGEGTMFRAHTESGDAYDFVVSEWVVPECITFSPVRGEGEDVYSITLESQTFRLRPLGEEETLVELSARSRARGIRGHFIARFFWPGFQKQGMQSALEQLASVFEETEGEGAGEVESAGH